MRDNWNGGLVVIKDRRNCRFYWFLCYGKYFMILLLLQHLRISGFLSTDGNGEYGALDWHTTQMCC